MVTDGWKTFPPSVPSSKRSSRVERSLSSRRYSTWSPIWDPWYPRRASSACATSNCSLKRPDFQSSLDTSQPAEVLGRRRRTVHVCVCGVDLRQDPGRQPDLVVLTLDEERDQPIGHPGNAPEVGDRDP